MLRLCDGARTIYAGRETLVETLPATSWLGRLTVAATCNLAEVTQKSYTGLIF